MNYNRMEFLDFLRLRDKVNQHSVQRLPGGVSNKLSEYGDLINTALNNIHCNFIMTVEYHDGNDIVEISLSYVCPTGNCFQATSTTDRLSIYPMVENGIFTSNTMDSLFRSVQLEIIRNGVEGIDYDFPHDYENHNLYQASIGDLKAINQLQEQVETEENKKLHVFNRYV